MHSKRQAHSCIPRLIMSHHPQGNDYRSGEASHPGPIIRMPGDGHCLYHAIGWWVHQTADQIRDRLGHLTPQQWDQVFPGGTESMMDQFRLETLDRREWGGALQIAAAAVIYHRHFRAHTPSESKTSGPGH